MSLALGLLVVVLFIAYAAYELFGSKLKLAIKSFMPMIRVAVVGFVVMLLLYLYCTNTSMFMTLVETIAPEPITKAMNIVTGGANNTENPTPEPHRIKRSVSAAKKKRVAASQNWKCDICEETLDETYEIDHELALCDGGTNDDSNLRALCRPCHAKKTAEERLNRSQ